MEKKKTNKKVIWTVYYIVVFAFATLAIFSLLGIFIDDVAVLFTKMYVKRISWMEKISTGYYVAYGKILSYIYLTFAPIGFLFIAGFHNKIHQKKHQIIARLTWWLALIGLIGTVVLFFRNTKPYFEMIPKYEGNETRLALGFIPIFGSFKDFLENFKNLYVLYALPIFMGIILFIRNDQIGLKYGITPAGYFTRMIIWNVLLIGILPFIIVYVTYAIATVVVIGACVVIGFCIFGAVANMPGSDSADKVLLSDGTVLTKNIAGGYTDSCGNHWDDLGNGNFEL